MAEPLDRQHWLHVLSDLQSRRRYLQSRPWRRFVDEQEMDHIGRCIRDALNHLARLAYEDEEHLRPHR